MSCNKEMVDMIGVLNKLQDKLISLGVTNLVKQLPQIVVIGSQSAGKSSVLESFVGRDFLPRGSDIVTRRPLILQLKQNRSNKKTFAKFGHSSKIFTNFNEIRKEIEDETNRTVPDSAISSDPISLMITSPDVLDLNLVDLPGMTKVPVGKQPEDIESIVKSLTISFIKNENSLILAVTPANQDLSTSDAIQLAREVDPQGKRTIGVLTKLDRMDKGTDARNILIDMHKIKLKKGFIGVINRSLKDIENNKSMSDAMADEKKFFAKHSAYKDIMHKLGVENLQKYLQQELAKHLCVELPTLHNKFKEELYDLEEEIEKITVTVNELTAYELISDTVKTFKQNFRNEIGTGDDVPVDRPNRGAIINVEMTVKYAEMLEEIVHDEDRIGRQISLAIKNIFGTRIELFVPNKAFTNVVRKQIELMRTPSLKCVDSVYRVLESIVTDCAKEIGDYPKLIEFYTNASLEYLRECKKKCKEMVEHILETEKSYLSATHDEFIKAIQPERNKLNPNNFPSTKLMISDKCGWIRYNDVDCYFSIENRYLYYSQSQKHSNFQRSHMDLRAMKTTFEKNTLILNCRNNTEMKLEFDSKITAIEWVSAIMNNACDEQDFGPKQVLLPGLNFGLQNSAINTNKNKVNKNDSESESSKYPIRIDSQVEEVKVFVLAYIKIMEKKLKDILPKYCQKELIDTTEKFVGDTLRNVIQKKGLKLDDLLDRDPMEEKLKDMLQRQTIYKETLQVMNAMLKSSKINGFNV